jgi:hypothetical protein
MRTSQIREGLLTEVMAGQEFVGMLALKEQSLLIRLSTPSFDAAQRVNGSKSIDQAPLGQNTCWILVPIGL